jgi:hypothetical protein
MPSTGENFAVLEAVQALVGNVSTDMRAVFVDGRAVPVTLHFVVASGRATACAEDIEDTLAEFEAQGTPERDPDVTATVHEEKVPRDWFERGWRPIYWAKDWPAWKVTEDGG